MKDLYRRATSRTLVTAGWSSVAVGIILTALWLALGTPTAVWICAMALNAVGGTMLGTARQRQAVAEDRQTRERRLAEGARPRPPHLDL